MNFMDVIGYLGCIISLGAYILVYKDVIKFGPKYHISNLISSILLGICSWSCESLPNLVVNIAWICTNSYMIFVTPKGEKDGRG